MHPDYKAIRDRLGLSQPEFALLFGVHHQTVSKWERGLLSPDSYRALLLKAADMSSRYDADLSVKIRVLLDCGHIATAIFSVLKPPQ